jgi:hypothetical protein
MSELLEAILTTVGIFGGYILAAIVVLVVTPKQERLPERLASAAIALTALFLICTAVFVASEYWLDSWPEYAIEGQLVQSERPTWLDAVNAAAENMLSEVFQIWLAAMYFKHRRWPGSPEDKG